MFHMNKRAKSLFFSKIIFNAGLPANIDVAIILPSAGQT